MKPKTKIQIEITADQKKLSKITAKHKKHALSFHDKFVSLSYSTKHYCLDCGHEWKADNKQTIKIGSCTCPSCKQTLKLAKTNDRYFQKTYYYGVIDASNNKQVVRSFQNTVYYVRGKAKEHDLNEVFQFWITEQGKTYFMTKTRRQSYYLDSFSSSSEIEFRNINQNSLNFFFNLQFEVYPVMNIIPKLKRNGFENRLIDIAPQKLFSQLLSSSEIETIYKSGRYELIEEADEKKFEINKFWQSVKIALKHDYKPVSYTLWFDYLKLLEMLEKDLKNHKLVCPENLKQAHDTALAKRRKIRKREELKQKIEKAYNDRREYVEKKMMFFNLFFQRENITVEPLKSIDDFIIEAEKMKHCVFENDYYKKKNSLILSAKVNGENAETIEIDLNKFKVIQSRGKFNEKTPYNKDIISLVNSNMNQIKRIQLTA